MTETGDLTGSPGGGEDDEILVLGDDAPAGAAASGDDAPAGAGSRGATARRWVARHKLVTAAAAVCLAVVATVSVIGSGSRGPAAQVAPGFSLPALGAAGHQVTLGQYAGKPLIVNFWASWCPPCKQETPLLAAFYRDQGGRVAVVGLDENDSSAAALKFAQAKGITYPIGFDPGMTASDAYGVYALPQTFVLNAQHHIVEHLYGALTTARLAHALELMRA